MRWRLLLAMALVILASLGSAQDRDHRDNAGKLLALERVGKLQATQLKGLKMLNEILDENFVVVGHDGVLMNKAQFLASITASNYSPDQIVNDAMRVDSYDHAVVVTGIYREEGSEKGKHYVRRGRFTDTWVQENGAWLCAASQETLLAH